MNVPRKYRKPYKNLYHLPISPSPHTCHTCHTCHTSRLPTP
ncbi:hypothetical protein [Moorena sp. SIO2C4]|nr:hypothetical protein [Moorena sp. SIO2C4]